MQYSKICSVNKATYLDKFSHQLADVLNFVVKGFPYDILDSWTNNMFQVMISN